MYVIKGLQLKGFKKSHCPKNKDLFCRVGKRPVEFAGSDESMPMSMNKMDAIEYMDRLDRESQRQADYDAYVAEQEKRRKESEKVPENQE